MSLTTVQEGQGQHDYIHELPCVRLCLPTRHVRPSGDISRSVGVHVTLCSYDESKDDCKGARGNYGTSHVRVNLDTTYLELHHLIARTIFHLFGVRPRDFPYGSAPGASFGKVRVNIEGSGKANITEETWEYLRYLLVDEDETAHFEAWAVAVPSTVSDEKRKKMAKNRATGSGGPRFRSMTLPSVQPGPSESEGSGLLRWFKRTRFYSV